MLEEAVALGFPFRSSAVARLTTFDCGGALAGRYARAARDDAYYPVPPSYGSVEIRCLRVATSRVGQGIRNCDVAG